MMYIELFANNSQVLFSAEMTKAMKLLNLSPVLVAKVKGKRAFMFKKATKKMIGKMQLGFAEGGRKKYIFSLAPTTISMLTELGYPDKQSKRFDVKQHTITETGEKFYYIGETL